MSLAALNLFGGSAFRSEWREVALQEVGLEIVWQGRTYPVTKKDVRSIWIVGNGLKASDAPSR